MLFVEWTGLFIVRVPPLMGGHLAETFVLYSLRQAQSKLMHHQVMGPD